VPTDARIYRRTSDPRGRRRAPRHAGL